MNKRACSKAAALFSALMIGLNCLMPVAAAAEPAVTGTQQSAATPETPVQPENQQPGMPGTDSASGEAESPAPVPAEPETPAPAEPETPVPAEPETPAPAEGRGEIGTQLANGETGAATGAVPTEAPANIGTEAELRMLMNNPSFSQATYTLTADITITTAEGGWTGIGTDNAPFNKIFEGNGHVITFENAAAGLFAVVGTGGEVRNLIVQGTIDSSAAQSTAPVGGIAGKLNGGTVSSCINLAAITGGTGTGAPSALGGLVGTATNTCSVTNSWNGGTVTALDTQAAANIAGIVGQSGSAECKITNCFNLGAVDNRTPNGKAAGIAVASGGITASYCYNAATVTGSSPIVDGSVTNASVKNCFYQGEGKAENEMTRDEMLSGNGFAGWKDTGAWEVRRGMYPRPKYSFDNLTNATIAWTMGVLTEQDESQKNVRVFYSYDYDPFDAQHLSGWTANGKPITEKTNPNTSEWKIPYVYTYGGFSRTMTGDFPGTDFMQPRSVFQTLADPDVSGLQQMEYGDTIQVPRGARLFRWNPDTGLPEGAEISGTVTKALFAAPGSYNMVLQLPPSQPGGEWGMKPFTMTVRKTRSVLDMKTEGISTEYLGETATAQALDQAARDNFTKAAGLDFDLGPITLTYSYTDQETEYQTYAPTDAAHGNAAGQGQAPTRPNGQEINYKVTASVAATDWSEACECSATVTVNFMTSAHALTRNSTGPIEVAYDGPDNTPANVDKALAACYTLHPGLTGKVQAQVTYYLGTGTTPTYQGQTDKEGTAPAEPGSYRVELRLPESPWSSPAEGAWDLKVRVASADVLTQVETADIELLENADTAAALGVALGQRYALCPVLEGKVIPTVTYNKFDGGVTGAQCPAPTARGAYQVTVAVADSEFCEAAQQTWTIRIRVPAGQVIVNRPGAPFTGVFSANIQADIEAWLSNYQTASHGNAHVPMAYDFRDGQGKPVAGIPDKPGVYSLKVSTLQTDYSEACQEEGPSVTIQKVAAGDMILNAGDVSALTLEYTTAAEVQAAVTQWEQQFRIYNIPDVFSVQPTFVFSRTDGAAVDGNAIPTRPGVYNVTIQVPETAYSEAASAQCRQVTIHKMTNVIQEVPGGSTITVTYSGDRETAAAIAAQAKDLFRVQPNLDFAPGDFTYTYYYQSTVQGEQGLPPFQLTDTEICGASAPGREPVFLDGHLYDYKVVAALPETDYSEASSMEAYVVVYGMSGQDVLQVKDGSAITAAYTGADTGRVIGEELQRRYSAHPALAAHGVLLETRYFREDGTELPAGQAPTDVGSYTVTVSAPETRFSNGAGPLEWSVTVTGPLGFPDGAFDEQQLMQPVEYPANATLEKQIRAPGLTEGVDFRVTYEKIDIRGNVLTGPDYSRAYMVQMTVTGIGNYARDSQGNPLELHCLYRVLQSLQEEVNVPQHLSTLVRYRMYTTPDRFFYLTDSKPDKGGTSLPQQPDVHYFPGVEFFVPEDGTYTFQSRNRW